VAQGQHCHQGDGDTDENDEDPGQALAPLAPGELAT